MVVAAAAASAAATDPTTVWCMCPPLGTANVAVVVALRQLYSSIDSIDMHSKNSAQQSIGRDGNRLDNLEKRGTKCLLLLLLNLPRLCANNRP